MTPDFHTSTVDAAAAHARWSAVDYDDRPTRADLDDSVTDWWRPPGPDDPCPACEGDGECSWCQSTGLARAGTHA